MRELALTDLDAQIELSIDEQTDDTLPLTFNAASIQVVNYQLGRLFASLGEGFTPNGIATEALLTLFGSPIDRGHDGFSMTDAQMAFAGLGLATPAASTGITRDASGVAIEVVSPRAEYSMTIDSTHPLGEAVNDLLIDTLGLAAPTAFVSSAARFDAQTGTISYDAFEFGVVDSFGINLATSLSGLLEQIAALNGADTLSVDDFDVAELISSSITVTDAGLSAALLDLIGGDGVLVRLFLTESFRLLLQTSTLVTFDPDQVDASTTDFSAWLENGGDFELSLSPLEPLSLTDLLTLGVSAEDLGWRTSVESPED